MLGSTPAVLGSYPAASYGTNSEYICYPQVLFVGANICFGNIHVNANIGFATTDICKYLPKAI
jgi:hypothetical protein